MKVEDIVNSSRKSGYDHVNVMTANGKSTYRGQAYARTKNERANALSASNHIWYGPARKTPEEAAADYVDWFNSVGYEPITPADLVNPARKSGFDHVNRCNTTGANPRWMGEKKGVSGVGKTVTHFRGVSRANPADAAQDYCDYINGQSNPRVARTKADRKAAVKLKSAGHKSRRDALLDTSDPEVAGALGTLKDAKAQARGDVQGYVYCIGEKDGHDAIVKVGYSVKPEARVAELQTGNPRRLFLRSYFAGTKADEKALHEKYIDDNVIGEWFRLSGALLSEFDKS